MGSDCHMYIQYKSKTDSDKWWWSFGGKLNPGRDYTMFGILANVRNSDLPNYYDPKGLPSHELSYECENDLYLYITKDGNCENETTLARAKSWGCTIINDNQGNPYKVKRPDWHSHSWLTRKELKQAFKWYKKQNGNSPSFEYRSILKIMKVLENKGKNEVELVFWFDN